MTIYCPGCKLKIPRSATRCPFCTCEIETVNVNAGTISSQAYGILIGSIFGGIIGWVLGVLLLNDKAIFVAISGAVVLAYLFWRRAKTKGLTVQRVKNTNDTNLMASTTAGVANFALTNEIKFNGERAISNDSYKIFLAKRYSIEKNDVLSKFICEDKLFENIEDALNFAAMLDQQSQKLLTVPKNEQLVTEAFPEEAEKNTVKIPLLEKLSAKKSKIFLPLILIVVVGIGYYIFTAYGNPNYKNFVGKPANSLFETSKTKNLIIKTIGSKANFDEVASFFSVQVPDDYLKIDDDFLVGSGCKQHQCDTSRGFIFINTKNNDLSILTTEDGGRTASFYGLEFDPVTKKFNKPVPVKSFIRFTEDN